jgi:hypothetical protein
MLETMRTTTVTRTTETTMRVREDEHHARTLLGAVAALDWAQKVGASCEVPVTEFRMLGCERTDDETAAA